MYGTSIRGKLIFTLASGALLGPIFITCKLIDIFTKLIIMLNDSLVLNDIVICLMSTKIPCMYNWTSQDSSRPAQTLVLQSEMKSERQICRGRKYRIRREASRNLACYSSDIHLRNHRFISKPDNLPVNAEINCISQWQCENGHIVMLKICVLKALTEKHTLDWLMFTIEETYAAPKNYLDMQTS